MFGRQPGIILADINPLYLNALLPHPFVAAPLDGKRYAALRRVVTYSRAGPRAGQTRPGQSRPVYALFVSEKEMEEKAARLPQIEGYEWVATKTSTRDAVILKLSPNNKE